MSCAMKTLGDVCRLDNHMAWVEDALQRRNLCAVCHDILATPQRLLEAISDDGFHAQVPLRELYETAHSAGCRMCTIFFYMVVHSLKDETVASWPISKFLDAYGAFQTEFKVRALLRPVNQRKSDYDIHELLVYGAIMGSGIQARGLNNSHLRFKVYAQEDDETATFIGTMGCDKDVDSDAAFSRIGSWMSACDNQHSVCSRPRKGLLPARIIDLSNPSIIRLCELQSGHGQYAALSYCWGSEKQLKTTQSSLEDAYSNIELSSLSLTIQDAVKVTRKIGLHYLWVDALCIVQDSPEDMDDEIRKMAHIYQNASVTIMAANASDSSQGFLTSRGSRRRLEPESLTCHFELPMVFPNGTVHNVGIEYSQWDNGTSPEPLDHRAWAYQESLLSRRTLIYGTSTLTWRCRETVQGWNSWVRGHQKNITRVLLPKSGSRDLYKTIWKDLVALYGRRDLTFSEDKLPAISALASEILRLSEDGGGDPGRYLAGIWENDLLDQLVWFADPRESYNVRDIPYRAPSWSWASVDCHILYPDPRSGITSDVIQNNVGTELEVFDCSVTPRSEVFPMGQVVDGRLRARGCLIQGSSVPDYETWLPGTFRGPPSAVVLKLDCYEMGDRAAIMKARSCVWLRVQHRHGLVLEHVEGSVYRRIGYVVYSNWPGQDMDRTMVEII